MQTLTKDNLSLYIFDDATEITQTDTETIVGNPAEFIIGDCNINNTVLHTGVTPPADWTGHKYLFDGSDWTINPNYQDPVE